MYKLNPITGKFDIVNDPVSPNKKYRVPQNLIDGVVVDDNTGERAGTSAFNLPADIDLTADFSVYVGQFLKDETDDYTHDLTQISFTLPPLVGNSVVIIYKPKN